MKLRIKGNSVRFRLSQSEVARLAQADTVEECIYFGSSDEAHLKYALKVSASTTALSVEYVRQSLTVFVGLETVLLWAATAFEVGIYGSVDVGRGLLEVLIEKDFACLDAGEEENRDTFPNPIACIPVAK